MNLLPYCLIASAAAFSPEAPPTTTSDAAPPTPILSEPAWDEPPSGEGAPAPAPQPASVPAGGVAPPAAPTAAPPTTWAPPAAAALPTTAATTPPAVPPTRPSGKPMLIAGVAVFLSTYAASSLAGAIVYDTTDSPHRREFGQRMMIPLVGPFLAATESQTATGAWFTGLLGVAQATGVALSIVGAARMLRSRRPPPRYVFTGGPIGNGGQASFAMRF